MSEKNCLSCSRKAELHPRDDQKISCEKYHWEITRSLAAKQRVCSISKQEERAYAKQEKKARRAK